MLGLEMENREEDEEDRRKWKAGVDRECVMNQMMILQYNYP
jgi:hypothetical protein